jgi:hypothetical protein
LKYYIGIDNGVSGSIGILNGDGKVCFFGPTPTKKVISYTKTKIRHMTRIDVPKLHTLFIQALRSESLKSEDRYRAFIERPMINPTRFQASLSARASLEATLIVLEDMDIPYEFIDSKVWQKAMLPKGVTGEQLKSASHDIGARMFAVEHTGDYDGLLIAEWARRLNL